MFFQRIILSIFSKGFIESCCDIKIELPKLEVTVRNENVQNENEVEMQEVFVPPPPNDENEDKLLVTNANLKLIPILKEKRDNIGTIVLTEVEVESIKEIFEEHHRNPSKHQQFYQITRK